MQEDILKQVTDYYLQSQDFNGLPIYKIDNLNIDNVLALIDEEKIDVLSEKFVINPHIKALKLSVPKEEQKREVKRKGAHVVLYPTEKYLKSLNLNDEKPFSKMLIEGKSQLNIIYFDIEILEMYFQNPKYYIYATDYRGSIYVSDDHYDEDNESEYIKDFGLGYRKGSGREDRCVGVFLGDLGKLSLNAQLQWKIKMLKDQGNYLINPNFYKNLILGEWVDQVSIYDALLEEMIIINNMCDNMKIPHLFREIFKPHSSERPDDYRIIFLPTLKNYYSFVAVLEKIVVHNLNHKAFLEAGLYVRTVGRKDEQDNDKGSLVMLLEWLNKNIVTPENLEKIIVNPLKELRKIRQIPAHELISNEYNKQVYKWQNEIIKNIYGAVSAIRIFFSSHPANKNVKIPDYLADGGKIVIY